jgi:SAM-dependent methyltransferase
MPGPALRALTRLRGAVLLALEPVDYAARLINGKGHLPPLRIRRRAGPLRGLERSGAEFAAYLKLMCDLDPHSRVLDVGCGFGLLALELRDYLSGPGSYVGVDVDRGAIAWARRSISRSFSRFEFQWLDIRNAAYNPDGRLAADAFQFPFEAGSFDVIVLKSVFTHLRPEAMRQYLSEAGRLLSSRGACLATFFVLDDEIGGSGGLQFQFGDGDWAYAVRNLPELAIAYKESSLRAAVSAAGLTVKANHPGTWSGRPGGLSYQDVLVLTHAS